MHGGRTDAVKSSSCVSVPSLDNRAARDDDVIHQVSCTSRHPPAIAGRAQASDLATERDKDLVLT
jgi:hypothetical protein